MNVMKKSLVMVIIFLFIGVAIAPSINFTVVKASNDNDLVEVTSEACGIQGFGNTTVKLTKQQYQNLEQYLVDFRARLNETTTREETVPIFKDAVVELNKYGLLPKGMSVEQAQILVTGQNINLQSSYLLNGIIKKNKLFFNRPLNLMCLVFGDATCVFGGPLLNLLDFIINFFPHYWPGPIYTILILTIFFLLLFENLFPLSLLHTIILRNSEGWVITAGLLGIQNQAGDDLSGKIYGFTGIKFGAFKDYHFFGFALISYLGEILR
jgi:hypothetical protein